MQDMACGAASGHFRHCHRRHALSSARWSVSAPVSSPQRTSTSCVPVGNGYAKTRFANQAIVVERLTSLNTGRVNKMVSLILTQSHAMIQKGKS